MCRKNTSVLVKVEKGKDGEKKKTENMNSLVKCSANMHERFLACNFDHKFFLVCTV
jgi:hypothetical protein